MDDERIKKIYMNVYARRSMIDALRAVYQAAHDEVREEHINILGKEYVDPERFGAEANVYNSAVGYCIGALRARKSK